MSSGHFSTRRAVDDTTWRTREDYGPFTREALENMVKRVAARSDRTYIRVAINPAGRLSVGPTRTLEITAGRFFARKMKEELIAAGDRDNIANATVYYPDLRLAGRVSDIVDALLAYGFTSVPVGKKFAMVEEANDKLLATGQNRRFTTLARAGGDIDITNDDMTEIGVTVADRMLYENSFDPLLDNDEAVIKTLFPSSPPETRRRTVQTEALSEDRAKIEEAIRDKVDRLYDVIIPRHQFIDRVKDRLDYLFGSGYSRVADAVSATNNGSLIDDVIDDMLTNTDFPLTLIGNGNFVGNREKLEAISAAIDRSTLPSHNAANLARVFSSIVADPTKTYDSSSRVDLEHFMYDLDALVSAGILENHDFKITVLQPLIRYSS